jgi:hypothetical protein
MVQTIRHKGLRIFYETGNGGKLPKEQLAKISRILTALDALSDESDIRSLGNPTKFFEQGKSLYVSETDDGSIDVQVLQRRIQTGNNVSP